MITSVPASICFFAWAGFAYQPPDLNAQTVGAVQHESGRAKAGGDHGYFFIEQDFQLGQRPFLVQTTPGMQVWGRLWVRNVVLLFDRLFEITLLLRDHGQQLFDRLFFRNRSGKHQVNTKGFAPHAVANPFDVRRDVVGRVHGLAEDGKAPGIDHSDCNVLAVRKRNHRVLDAQFVTQLGMQWIAHPGLSSFYKWNP